MAALKVVNAKVSPETLASWRESNTEFETHYFVDPEAETLEVPSYQYEITTKNGTWGDWYWAKFTLKGEKKAFEFRCNGNKVLDVESPMTIMKFVCAEEFTASNGTVVEKDKVQWRACQD